MSLMLSIIKHTLLLLVITFTSVVTYAKDTGVVYDITILSVIDGDTVVISAPYLPPPLKPQLAIRVYGVDAPEKGFRAKCDSERARSERAQNFTVQVIDRAKSHQMLLMNWDKFGGRIIGDVILDGKSLREMLISNGHAREYYGGRKHSWCN